MAYRTISKEESQVGKYVDLNGDGKPEGVIFLDLATDIFQSEKETFMDYINRARKPTISIVG